MNDLVALERLRTILSGYSGLAVAVSGGVDSMTLAHVSAGVTDTIMVHAISPAVPPAATERVRSHARRFGWRLTTTDAGEFADPAYVANPANRCYFCKSNLYQRISGLTDRSIASGANLDDLADYRPGLAAAGEHRVVHPLVDAAIDKRGVRAIARALALPDLAELPAQPCLASRIETGIAIDADDLAFINAVETGIRSLAPNLADVRCRILRRGVVVEVDGPTNAQRESIEAFARRATAESSRRFSGVAPYRRGSAFLLPKS